MSTHGLDFTPAEWLLSIVGEIDRLRRVPGALAEFQRRVRRVLALRRSEHRAGRIREAQYWQSEGEALTQEQMRTHFGRAVLTGPGRPLDLDEKFYVLAALHDRLRLWGRMEPLIRLARASEQPARGPRRWRGVKTSAMYMIDGEEIARDADERVLRQHLDDVSACLSELATQGEKPGRPTGSGDTSPKADRLAAQKWFRWRDAEWANGNYTASYSQYAAENRLDADKIKAAVDRHRKRPIARKAKRGAN